MSNWRLDAATAAMPDYRRLELGEPSEAFEICVRDDAALKHPDLVGKSLKEIGRCKIHEGRTHWRVS